jgi:hypothetical protein
MTTTLDEPRTIPGISSRIVAARDDASCGGAAAILVCCRMFAMDRWTDPRYVWTSVAAVMAFGMLSRPIATRGFFRRACAALVQITAMVAVLLGGDRVLDGWEERAPRFGSASAFASTALNLIGYHTAAERGLLLTDHPEGLVTVVPSMEKLALHPLLLFWLAWIASRLVRGHRDMVAYSIFGLAATLFVTITRFVVLLAVYVEHDGILSGNGGQAALDLFTSPWLTCFFLGIAGFVTDRASRLVAKSAAAPAALRPPARTTVASAVAIALVGAATGLAVWFVPPGKEKPGRILIDDRFCGIWEPTARQLDTEWYGDFPTYSFTSLAEWLGKWYSADANTTRPYSDELLSHYDVLILKTPEEPIPEAETAAIDRFVRRGGGLLLVGDHTNLLGMGTHLNALSAKHGIRFRYDSVSDGLTGGFVECVQPWTGRHVGALHVDKLQFMTSCSLQISGDAQTVLAAENCRREPHDYAGSSYFGRRGPHPEMEHGRTVLAATTRVGRGQIAAFTDSTVWSSFAVFSHDREKLAMDLVRMLNRQQSPYETPIRCAAFVIGLVAVLLVLWMIRSGMALPAVLFGLVGFWGGALAAEGLHHAIYAWPEPNSPVSEVTFLWQGGACAFPPVLGTPGSLAADRCFDTLQVSVQRLGLVPRVAYTFEDDFLKPETRAMFVVAPVNAPPARTMARLKDFVRRGGGLVVLDDSRIGERGSAKDFLNLFEASITYHGAQSHGAQQRPHVHLGGGMLPLKVPAADAFVARKFYEQGQVVYMSDAADFSREGMGHCFARPWKSARARYETVFMLFRDVLRIAPADRRFYGIL